MEAKTLVDNLADKVAESDAEVIGDTQIDVEVET